MREEYLKLYEEIRTLAKDDEQAAIGLAEETSQQAAAADLPTLAAFFAGMAHYFADEYEEAVEFFDTCAEDLTFSAPGHAWFRMGYAYDEQTDYDRAIDCYQKALAEETFDTPGDAWNNMGNAYDDKGDYERAIECYEKALAEDTYKTPGDALNNMGLAYDHKGDYDRAIECYDKALAEKTFDTPGAAWYNMGLAYYHNGDYDRAIEYYQKALAEETFHRRGDALNNMGLAYDHNGDYDRAIECYEKALAEETYDTPGKVLHNMGTAYRLLGKADKATQNYQRAIEEFEKAGAHTNAEIARSLLRSIDADQDDDASALSDLLIEPDRTALRDGKARLVAKWGRTKRTIVEHWALRGKDSDLDDVMVFLKGWSSSIPWIAAAQLPVPPPTDEEENHDDQPDTAMPLAEITPAQRSHFQQQLVRGGGYFLKWNGRGTVIDPGVSFVTNFLAQGCHAKEIHHVLTTHHHIDHTADLVPVQNIVNEYTDALREPFDLLRCCYWDLSTYNSNRELFQTGTHRPHDLRADEEPVQLTDAGLTITPVDSLHCENSVALRFDLTSPSRDPLLSIGLSSDADPEAAGDLIELFQDSQLIVLHFSKTNELDLLQERPIEGHLGYTGCKQIMEATDAEVYVLAEFSGERGDHRFEITKTLGMETDKEGRIIPADIGLTVCLPGGHHDFLGVRCSQCGKFCRVSQIKVLQPPHPFGPLTYFCPDCII